MIADDSHSERQDDDDRPVVDPELLQLLKKAADDRVGRGDLAVVGGAVAGEEGLGRDVRSVRLVDVKQEKERLLGLLGDPLNRPRGRLLSRPLVAGALPSASRADGVVIEVEEGSEPRLVPEDVRRNRGPRHVAVLLQVGRHVADHLAIEEEPGVVADPVLGRERTREKRGMRRKRQGNGRVRIREDPRLAREGVERRRFDLRVAVGGEAIRPECVNGNENDRGVGVDAALVLRFRTARVQGEKDGENNEARAPPSRSPRSAGRAL